MTVEKETVKAGQGWPGLDERHRSLNYSLSFIFPRWTLTWSLKTLIALSYRELYTFPRILKVLGQLTWLSRLYTQYLNKKDIE